MEQISELVSSVTSFLSGKRKLAEVKLNNEELTEDWVLIDSSPYVPDTIPIQPKSNNLPKIISSITDSFSSKKGSGVDRKKPEIPPKMEKEYYFPCEEYSFTQNVDGEEPYLPIVEDFEKIFSIIKVDLNAVRNIAWNKGIPRNYRSDCWNMLIGHYTLWPHTHKSISQQKRIFYDKFTQKNFHDQSVPIRILAKIKGEATLTGCKVPYFQNKAIQGIIERVSYISYKESLDDYLCGTPQLILPFLFVTISKKLDLSIDKCEKLSKEEIQNLESDVFWQFYTFLQFESVKRYYYDPSKVVDRIEEYLVVIDKDLYAFLIDKEVDISTFTYEWTMTLLFNNIQKMNLITMLWDKYICLGEVFSEFHACVCASIIAYYKPKILKLEAPVIIEHFKLLHLKDWDYQAMERFISYVVKNAEKLKLKEECDKIMEKNLILKRQTLKTMNAIEIIKEVNPNKLEDPSD